jgi:hypothetical protein
MAAAHGPEGDFENAELAAILAHQLRGEVIFELQGLGEGSADLPADCLAIESFHELFHQPEPPLELLRLTKDYAKRLIIHPDSGLLTEVARVLYFASIASALVHYRQKITHLTEQEVRDGIRWCLDQPWMHPSLEPIFIDALPFLENDQRP